MSFPFGTARLMSLCLGASLALAPQTGLAQSACAIAEILYGPIRLDIVPHTGSEGAGDYETAIVRSATFDDPTKNFGAILGEITVDRGSFAVRDINQLVVGIITPELKIEGRDEACDTNREVQFVRASEGAYITLSDGQPLGTLDGRFPANGFGAE